MTKGTVRDIRTGRAIAQTNSLTDTFTHHVQGLIEADEQFYIVHGPCRHREVREMIDFFKELGLPLIYDRNFPDMVFTFSGEPQELGFAV